jgi:predicted  nucleic acid-binding Zn-ribbon protein
MSQDNESFLPFIFKVINDMYTRISEIDKHLDSLNKKMDEFTFTLTDRVVNLSEAITGIIQIIKANREVSFQFFSNSINELKTEIHSIRDKRTELGKLEGQLAEKMSQAKKYLQDKMADAEFLSLVFQLKDLSNELRALKSQMS